MNKVITSYVFTQALANGASTTEEYVIPAGATLHAVHVTPLTGGVVHVITSLMTPQGPAGSGTTRKLNQEIPGCTGWTRQETSGIGGVQELSWDGNIPIPTDRDASIELTGYNMTGATISIRLSYIFSLERKHR